MCLVVIVVDWSVCSWYRIRATCSWSCNYLVGKEWYARLTPKALL